MNEIVIFFRRSKSKKHCFHAIVNQNERTFLRAIAKHFQLGGIFLQFSNKIVNDAVVHAPADDADEAKHYGAEIVSMRPCRNQPFPSHLSSAIKIHALHPAVRSSL